MSSKSFLVAAALTLFFMAVIIISAPIEQGTPDQPQAFMDCAERVSIPIMGIRTFAFCETDSTVWTGDQWADPTPFEWRRVRKYYGQGAESGEFFGSEQ